VNDHPGTDVLDKLLAEARPEQREAVTAPEPLVVVGAGAGTGKTKTLAWRFLWALLSFPETRVENILTLTFTEKAAREMRDRIAKMLDSSRKAAEAGGTGKTRRPAWPTPAAAWTRPTSPRSTPLPCGSSGRAGLPCRSIPGPGSFPLPRKRLSGNPFAPPWTALTPGRSPEAFPSRGGPGRKTLRPHRNCRRP
jgi:Superfamily I DNA and RNA helicases